MELTEEIRHFVFEKYIKPARDERKTKVVVVSGDVHSRMGLKNRIAAVCNALRAEKFQEKYKIQLIQ
jgi:5-methylcytosine-specific restriction enzyme B